MPVHGQTITWDTHVGRSAPEVRGHWLQRIRQWLNGRPEGTKEAPVLTFYGNWDKRYEPFRPPRAEFTLEHAARHDGQSWFIALHSAAL